MLLFVPGMPPHMAPRPGMPLMGQPPAVGSGMPSRPAAPPAQPAVTKPLFPSAAQVNVGLDPCPGSQLNIAVRVMPCSSTHTIRTRTT